METSDLKEDDTGGGIKFECGICLKEFSTAWCLQIHVKTHDEKRSFDCHECGKIFPDFPGLCEHLKQHIFGEEPTLEPQELCNICGKEYPRSQISMHKRSHIFKPGLTCKICGKSFGSSQVLKLHLRTHDKKSLYQCQTCDLRFASRNSLALHWNCHPNLESPRPENRSNNSKENARSLNCSSNHTKSFQRHKKVGKKFKCTICSKTFQTCYKVEDHIHVCHSQFNQKKDQATPSKTFTRSNSSVTTKDKSKNKAMFSIGQPFFGLMTTVGKHYICTVCKKEFQGKVKADSHASYHFHQFQQKLQQNVSTSDIKSRHNSDIRGFRQDEILLHKGHRDFDKALSYHKVVKEVLNCSECGKSFHNTEDLRAHLNIHVKDYEVRLMKMLSPKQSMTLSFEPQNCLQAAHSEEKSTYRKDDILKKTSVISDSSVNAVSIIALEDTIMANDCLEMECLGEDDLNGTFLSDPDIFVSPDSSQSKKTKHKETDQVSLQTSPSNNMNSDLTSKEIMKYILSKGNHIKCKICSKQFSNIERISSHVKSHLKKGDHKNYELKDFPDLHHMTSVRVVLERLDLGELGKHTNTEEDQVNNVSTKEAGTNTPTYMAEDIVESEIKSHMDAPDKSTLGTKSQYEDNLPSQTADSDDDVDRFEESTFSDVPDIEWEPSKSVEDCTTTNKSRILSVEFDASDTEGHSDETKSRAIAAAIAICEDSQIEEDENIVSSSPDTERENSQKQSLEVSSDASGGRSSDQSGNHTAQSLQFLETSNFSKSKHVDQPDPEQNEEILAMFRKQGDLYVCSICSREYEYRQEMCYHIANHLTEQIHKCKFCGCAFNEYDQLCIHLDIHEKHHTKYGGVTDDNVQAIQANYDKQNGIYECKLCSFHCRLAIEAYNHVLHHLFSKFQEGSQVYEKNSLIQSSEVSTTEQSDCHKETRQRKFTMSDAMKFIVEENDMYKCLKCQTSIKKLQSAKEHVKRHVQGAVFKCTVCSFATYSRHHRDRHSQTHKKRTNFEINLNSTPECIDTLKSGEGSTEPYKASEASQFYVKEKNKFKCTICGSVLSSEQNAKLHIQRHKQSNRYKCSYCPYSQFSKHHVMRHMKTHLKDKDRKTSTPEIIDTESDQNNRQYLGSRNQKEENHLPRTSSTGHAETVSDSKYEDAMQNKDENAYSNKKYEKQTPEWFSQSESSLYIVKENEKYKCTICGISLSILKHAKVHVKRHKQSYRFKCTDCSYHTPSRHHLERHKNTHNKRTNTIMKEADEMGTEAASSTQKRDDIPSDLRTKGSTFQCLICLKKFTIRKKAYIHIRNHLKRNIAQKNECTSEVENQKGNSNAPLKGIKTNNQKIKPLSGEEVSGTYTQEKAIAPFNGTENRNRGSVQDDKASKSTENILIPEDIQIRHENNASCIYNKRSWDSVENSKASKIITDFQTHQVGPHPKQKDNNYEIQDNADNLMEDTVKKKSSCELYSLCKRKRSDTEDASDNEDTTEDAEKSENNDVSSYQLRVRKKSALYAESVPIELSDCEKQNVDEDVTDDDMDSDYKCDYDCEDSETENMTENVTDNASSDIKDLQHAYPCQEEKLSPKCKDKPSYEISKKNNIAEKSSSVKSSLQQKIESKHLTDREQDAVDVDKNTSESPSLKISDSEVKRHLLESKSHIERNIIRTGKNYECQLCNKKFKLRTQIHTHVTYHFQRRKYRCPDCGYATTNKTYIAVHMNKHNKRMIDFPCKICSLVFSKPAHLTSHLKSHTDEDKVKYLNYLKCKQCSQVLKTVQALYRHKLQHLDTLACKCCDEVFETEVAFENHAYEMSHFFCDECRKTFNTFRQLDEHQKRVHEEKFSFQCEECGKQFVTKSELRQHGQSHQQRTFKELKHHQSETTHQSELQCQLCGRHFKTTGRLECHRLIHQALEEIGEDKNDGSYSTNINHSQNLKCPECRKEFHTLNKLKEHVRIHVEGKRFQCDICGSAFRQESHLKTHFNVHNNFRPFECKICFKRFYSKPNMDLHIKKSHQRKVQQTVTCDICGKKLSRLSLKNHKLIHNKNTYVKRFPCEQCEKKFYTAAMLKTHLRTHSDETRVMCDICGKSLRNKYILQLHRQGHTGEKPFKCDICGKAFKLKMWLQRHNRIHTGEKPFKCDICDKAFRFQDTLQNHRYIHTGEKPYKCDLCGERFKDRWARHKHVKRHGKFSRSDLTCK